MTFDKEHLRKIIKLSKLAIEPAELLHLEDDLRKIVSFVEQLNEVNVAGVEPMTHAGDRSLHLREDEAKIGVARRGLSSSLGYEEGLIKVPKIIE